jgi:hypothetical protein
VQSCRGQGYRVIKKRYQHQVIIFYACPVISPGRIVGANYTKP